MRLNDNDTQCKVFSKYQQSPVNILSPLCITDRDNEVTTQIIKGEHAVKIAPKEDIS